jgi:hypothetical protein
MSKDRLSASEIRQWSLGNHLGDPILVYARCIADPHTTHRLKRKLSVQHRVKYRALQWEHDHPSPRGQPWCASLRESVSVQKAEVMPIQLPQGQNLEESLRLVCSTFNTMNEYVT